MTSRISLLLGGFAALAVSAAASAAAQAPVDVSDWNGVLAKAKQEGVVVVKGAPGRRYADVLQGAFQKKYPDIRVEFAGLPGRTANARILRERQAGIFNQDIWISGSSAIRVLKPAGALQPFKPFLRKETMEDKHWIGGFAAGFADYEQTFYYSFDGSVQNPIQVNWDLIEKDQLKTVQDLLKPEFAGKIAWDDPRVGGSGNGVSLTILENFGEDFLRRLYSQKIVFTTNRRLLAEWAVRGRYPISLGMGENDLEVFLKEGLGKNVLPLGDSAYKVQMLSPGFGSVGIIDKAPNPNAAAVYVNWLLSQEGQQAWVNVPRNSRRTDVKVLDPKLSPKPGVTYFNGHHEKYSEVRQRLQELARQVIAAPMPKERKKRGKGKSSSDSK
ncbi:MAG: extracellular solute-binding protein [Alphaproteobacteria bacterium]|nr:extracellular solute-binding protein [Alphaproteobacteria bacterium]